MQGTIAQVVALTIHGNSILEEASSSHSRDFQRLNSTFTHCESVQFCDALGDVQTAKTSIYAADPHNWFERLKEERVYALRMKYGPSEEKKAADRILVGFVGGGGKWLVETCGPERSDYWMPRWLVGNRERVDKRIWRVTYFRSAASKPSHQDTPENLEGLKDEMKENLRQIAQFSRSQNLGPFKDAFESGLSRLESLTPLEGLYHKDIAPVGFLPLSAEQLLGAAEAAWVFGGMGSWNDLNFEGQAQERYEQLSEKLYKLLNRAIGAAANSAIRSGP